MIGAEFEKAMACLMAWREERSNGINGMLGVLFVLRNRAASKHFGFPSSWLENIDQHAAFSSMTMMGDSQLVVYPDVRDPAFQKVLAAVDGIYDNSIPDRLTNGALFYADLNSPGFNSPWFKKTIIGNPERFPRTASVGTTTYFGQVS